MPEADPAGVDAPARRERSDPPEPPPLTLPGSYLGAALAFLLAGAAVLAWRAPALAAGSISDGGVIAAVHLLTLGWISTSIMGVLCQMLPMALGVPLRSEGLAWTTLAAWAGGVAAFVVGNVGGVRFLLLPGALLLGLGVLLFLAQLAASLPRARRRGVTWWCVAGAGVGLLGAWVLGLLLAINLGTGLLGTGRFPVLAIHVHVAAGGWVLLAVIGVSDHTLPSFLRSRRVSGLPGRVAASLIGLATAALLLSEHLLPVGVLRPALWTMAAGAAAFLLQALLRYRARAAGTLDPGMRLVAGALLLLALAVAAGAVALLAPRPSGRLLTAYGVLLIPGGLGLIVAGHYYRIVPALVWSARFAPVAAEREVPAATELVEPGPARLAGTLMVAGVAGMAAGAWIGSAVVCLAAAAGFGIGALAEALQMARIARRA